MIQNSKSQTVAKNTGYIFLRMILVLLVSLYTSRVVLHVLGFEDFGIFNVVGSVVVFLSFLRMALTNATYRFFAYEIGTGNTKRLTEIYSMAINSHIILALVMVVLLELGGVWFINNHLNIPSGRLEAANWVFQFSLLAFAINVIQTPFHSNIIAHERMDFYAFVSIIEVVLKLAIVYLLTLSAFDKLAFYGLLQCVVTLIIFLLYLFYCRKVFKDCRYIRIWDKSIAKSFISYSGWSMIVNLADVSANQCMNIFINIFIGVVANAAMGVALQVIGGITAFLNSFTQAMNPQIIKSYAARQYDYFMKLVFTSSKISYFLLLMISLPLIANIEFVLRIWLGNYPSDAPSYIRILILYSLFESTQIAFLQAVHATGRIKTHQLMMSSLKFASIPVMYYVLWAGHPGTWMLSIWIMFTFLWCTVRLVYMHYLINMSLGLYIKEVLLKVVIISVVVIPITFWITRQLSGWYGFVVSSVACTTLLLIMIWYYGLSQREQEIIISLLPSRNRFKRKQKYRDTKVSL